VSAGLRDRTVLVTGGAQGIGRSTVERFLAEGANVAFLDVDAARSQELVGAAAAPERLLFAECDLRVEAEVAAAVAATTSRFGGLDCLVNNAGVNAYFDPVQMTADDWETVFAIDLRAAWMCAKYALPALCASGHGAIVNVASIHALMTTEGMFPYAAAKSGLLGLSRSLALEYADRGVRVNAICPGYVDTRLVREWVDRQPDPGIVDHILTQLPLGRFGRADEVAGLIAFLCSDDATYITAATFSIDGGLSARFAS
jgi:NAD(P)-dependent dehydrogenase (short-subunit alcohol dehydrogenase family)